MPIEVKEVRSRIRRQRGRRCVSGVNACVSVLLAAALGLLMRLHLNPFTTPWLSAKLIALAGYIVFGSLALKRGRNRRTRNISLLIALGLFAYMVGTALTRDPGFLFPG